MRSEAETAILSYTAYSAIIFTNNTQVLKNNTIYINTYLHASAP